MRYLHEYKGIGVWHATKHLPVRSKVGRELVYQAEAMVSLGTDLIAEKTAVNKLIS